MTRSLALALNALGLYAVALVLVIAFGAQLLLNELPCPLCLLQRIHALAGNVRQLVLVDEGHLGVLRLRSIREDAAERQSDHKQRTEDAFHRAPVLRLADAGSGSCL